MTDLLVGAPMFMVRDSDGRLEELGRVYVYMQNGPLDLTPQLPHLTGTQAFGRFGSSITSLGDLNQDGYNGERFSQIFTFACQSVFRQLYCYQSILDFFF